MSSWRRSLVLGAAEVVRVGPHAGAHRAALRAGFTVFVPLCAVTAAGHVGWTIYAAFGAFASLYGRNLDREHRAGMQLVTGAALCTAVSLGTLVSRTGGSNWPVVGLAAAIAGLGALLSEAMAWHPPGPLFLVFAFAACAALPGDAADLPAAALVSGATAVFAVFVGGVGILRARAVYLRPVLPRLRLRTTLRRPDQTAQLVRYTAAPGLAGVTAALLGQHHTYWAMIAALVPMAGQTSRGRLVRAAQRLLGTLLGLVVAWLVLTPHPSPLACIMLIGLTQTAAELFIARNYALALVFVTPLALLMGFLVHPAPVGGLLVERLLDTVLGVAVAACLSLLVRDREDLAALPAPPRTAAET